MVRNKPANIYLWTTSVILLFIGLLTTACLAVSEETVELPEGVRTWLLVRAPEKPLPINRPVIVKSRTEDVDGVSHVELYAVETPAGNTDVLIRADRAPFAQTSFTASQPFTPLQKGHYVIKVVGYNRLGETAVSDFIGFDVE